MTTSQADPAYSTAEEGSNPTNPITAPDAGADTAQPEAGKASAKEQLSFAQRHRAPTTKDVETNRWTGAAAGTLQKGTGGLHGGGLVPEGWTPEDGPVGGSAAGTGVGGSGVRKDDPLKREEEMGVAGAGAGAVGEWTKGEGYDSYDNTATTGTGTGVAESRFRREEEMGTAGAGAGPGAGAMTEGYDDGYERRGEGYDSYDNTSGTGTGMGTGNTSALNTTGAMGNAGLTGSAPGGTAPGADGYEHAHAPGTGLQGAEYADDGRRGHNYSDSGVGGVGDETIKGDNMGEYDGNDTTGTTTKKNPLKKIVEAVKNI